MKKFKYKKLNRKQKNLFGLGIIVFVVLVSVVLWLVFDKSATIKQDFHIENADKITKFVIKDRDNNAVILEKKSDSLWTVNKKYEASLGFVNTMIETLREMRIRELIPKAARNRIIKSLASEGKIAEIYVEDYRIKFWFVKLFKHQYLKETYYVGHETSDGMGTYMLKKGEKNPYIIYIPRFKGYLATRFTAIEDSWRSHAIFKYKQSEIESLKIELPNDSNENFTLVNNGKWFSFFNAQGTQINEFDTGKVVALLSSFVDMNYERIMHNIPKIEQDTIFTKAPAFIITIKDKKGTEQTLSTFVKLQDTTSIAKDENDFYNVFDVNRCYALTSKYPDTLLMQFYTLDNVLKPASYFMPNAPGIPLMR